MHKQRKTAQTPAVFVIIIVIVAVTVVVIVIVVVILKSIINVHCNAAQVHKQRKTTQTPAVFVIIIIIVVVFIVVVIVIVSVIVVVTVKSIINVHYNGAQVHKQRKTTQTSAASFMIFSGCVLYQTFSSNAFA